MKKKSLLLYAMFCIYCYEQKAQGLQPHVEFSRLDSLIMSLHWIICPYCTNADRQLTQFKKAIDENDTKTIEHIIRRRLQDANQRLLREQPSKLESKEPRHEPVEYQLGDLPLVYAAKKAHCESVEQLIKLGAYVNGIPSENPFNNSLTALIAVCATPDLPEDNVAKTVHILLEHGADPTRHVIMLTEAENTELDKLQIEWQKDPTKKRQILARIPQEWTRSRSALDFATKHRYTAAAILIRRALIDQRTQGLQNNGNADENQPTNNI